MEHSSEFSSKRTEVFEGEWRSSRGGILFTASASSCIVAAVYDPLSSTGFLGHFRIGDQSHESFKDMLTAISADVSDSGESKVWLGGATKYGQVFDSEIREIYNELIEAERQWSKDTFLHLGVNAEAITEQWLDNDQHLVEVTFDTITGEIKTSVDKLE